MLNLETRIARVDAARNHSIAGWDGTIETIEVSITDAKCKELGFEIGDSKHLDEKYDKDGKRYNGMFLFNNNCPVPETEKEARDLCVLLGTDLIKLVKAKVKTEYQNKVRGFLNAAGESKKAIEKARKQQVAQDIKNQVATGDLTMEQAFVELQKLI